VVKEKRNEKKGREGTSRFTAHWTGEKKKVYGGKDVRGMSGRIQKGTESRSHVGEGGYEGKKKRGNAMIGTTQRRLGFTQTRGKKGNAKVYDEAKGRTI